jgi:D-alanyl-D-alanine carboxypeptidase/D-alanyl-D-alanine-endopeptidase (penicillin-binding protein 4)
VDATALPTIPHIDPDQPDHVSYNPAISGLNLNFNRVHFEWKRQGGSYNLTMDARGARYAPEVRIARMQIANRRAPLYTHSNSGGIDNWTVAGSALGSGGTRWLPVRRPDLYAAEVFRTLARAQGVALPAGQVTQKAPRGTVLVEHRSPELTVILRDMLRFSTNLTAEVVGLAASGERGGLAPSGQQMTQWARGRLGLRSARFVDHSGLGDASRLSAEDMVRGLTRVRQETALASLLRDIPMRNSSGQVQKNHPVKIRAKTGTLNFASALAGYMTARDGRELAFAIFSADVPRRERLGPDVGDMPEGSAGWRKRARTLQLQLIDHWGVAYTTA